MEQDKHEARANKYTDYLPGIQFLQNLTPSMKTQSLALDDGVATAAVEVVRTVDFVRSVTTVVVAGARVVGVVCAVATV